jgi:murein DD-endopeptidase
VHIGWNPRGGGHTVVINHGDIHTAYFHGREATRLRRGQHVKAGDFIYTSGATGVATGPHLHFEVRRTQNQATHTDPMPFLENAPSPDRPPFPNLIVDGVMGQRTWQAWQIVLLRDWGYSGRIDGIPGPATNQAIQRSVRSYGYLGPINGNLGPQTRKAVQRRLNVKPDGVWGRITISTLQQRLNAGEY